MPVEGGPDHGVTEGDLDAQRKRMGDAIKKREFEEAAPSEKLYLEFPGSFDDEGDKNEKRKQEVARILGITDKETIESLTPRAAALYYLDNPNNRENSAFRYLKPESSSPGWGIDQGRPGDGIELIFQRLSREDKEEIERIFKMLGWRGEEYEAKQVPASE